MSIPGYDAWKLRTPEDDYEARGGRICPICGARSKEDCANEPEDGCELDNGDYEPDPDYLRDLRAER